VDGSYRAPRTRQTLSIGDVLVRRPRVLPSQQPAGEGIRLLRIRSAVRTRTKLLHRTRWRLLCATSEWQKRQKRKKGSQSEGAEPSAG
jgi:hypothetical protein